LTAIIRYLQYKNRMVEPKKTKAPVNAGAPDGATA